MMLNNHSVWDQMVSRRNNKALVDLASDWYTSAKFKTLAKKWHDKLAKSGFEDAEEFDSPLELMKQHPESYFNNKFTPEKFSERQRYYELARQLLHSFKFKDGKDKEIWNLHAEGLSYKEITKTLSLTISKVRTVIENTRKEIKKDAKQLIKDSK